MTKAEFVEIYQDWDEKRLLNAYENRFDYERAAREAMEIVVAEKFSSKMPLEEVTEDPFEFDETDNPGIYNRVGLSKQDYDQVELKLFGKYYSKFLKIKHARRPYYLLMGISIALIITLIIFLISEIKIELIIVLTIFTFVLILFTIRIGLIKSSQIQVLKRNNKICIDIKVNQEKYTINAPFIYSYFASDDNNSQKNIHLYVKFNLADGKVLLLREELTLTEEAPVDWEFISNNELHSDYFECDILLIRLGVNKLELENLIQLLNTILKEEEE